MLREHEGRVYFGGTETATKWPGYMDGGVQAGERAAREVSNYDGSGATEEHWFVVLLTSIYQERIQDFQTRGSRGVDPFFGLGEGGQE